MEPYVIDPSIAGVPDVAEAEVKTLSPPPLVASKNLKSAVVAIEAFALNDPHAFILIVPVCIALNTIAGILVPGAEAVTPRPLVTVGVGQSVSAAKFP